MGEVGEVVDDHPVVHAELAGDDAHVDPVRVTLAAFWHPARAPRGDDPVIGPVLGIDNSPHEAGDGKIEAGNEPGEGPPPEGLLLEFRHIHEDIDPRGQAPLFLQGRVEHSLHVLPGHA